MCMLHQQSGDFFVVAVVALHIILCFLSRRFLCVCVCYVVTLLKLLVFLCSPFPCMANTKSPAANQWRNYKHTYACILLSINTNKHVNRTTILNKCVHSTSSKRRNYLYAKNNTEKHTLTLCTFHFCFDRKMCGNNNISLFVLYFLQLFFSLAF